MGESKGLIDMAPPFETITCDAADDAKAFVERMNTWIGAPPTHEYIGEVRALISDMQMRLAEADSKLVDLAASLPADDRA